jgi:hypothetical protein
VKATRQAWIEPGLREISGAARALRILADYLERNPRALIFGKPKVNNGE